MPNIIAVLSSTTSDVTKLYPGHGGSNNRTTVNQIDYPPIFNIVSVNLSPNFGKEYKTFQLGRGIFRNISGDMNEVIQFAANKLTNGFYTFVRNDENTCKKMGSCPIKCKQAHLALFYCRFSITSISYMAKDLVSENMAVLVKLEMKEGNTVGSAVPYCECKYLSEPAFCEASALLTSNIENLLEAVVDDACSVINSNKPIESSLGDCGEMAMAAAITYAKDCVHQEINKSKYDANNVEELNYSNEIPLIDLLKKLKGDAFNEIIKKNSEMEAMFVSFTHFVRYPQVDRRIIDVIYKRRIGLYAPRNFAGIDKYISVRDLNNEISWIIQDKNYNTKIGEQTARELLDAMDPLLCPFVDKAAKFSICCLATTGEGVDNIVEMLEIDIGVKQLRFTLDMEKDFPCLSSSVKDKLKCLARPGCVAQLDEATSYSGVYDIVAYNRTDAKQVKAVRKSHSCLTKLI
jgi:hypothetical protein